MALWFTSEEFEQRQLKTQATNGTTQARWHVVV